jgi:type I site-specific restriction-modification system R (restriction) subunit
MKYIKKNRKSDEKKVVSTRIKKHIFDAFQNASEASKDYGYSISLSDVVETALIDAVKEFAEVSDIDYLDIELGRLQKEWEEEWEKEQAELSRKEWEKESVARDQWEEQRYEKDMKEMDEEIEEERIKQLEADQKAVLELSAGELKEYQQKRSDEVAAKKLKHEEMIKRLKEKYGEDHKFSFLDYLDEDEEKS